MNDAGRGHGGERIADVLLPVPVSHPYRYIVPDALAVRAVVGARVVVPVQRRRVIGVVLAVAEGPLDRALKPVADAPDAEPRTRRQADAAAVDRRSDEGIVHRQRRAVEVGGVHQRREVRGGCNAQ